jgi:hypothetical protein
MGHEYNEGVVAETVTPLAGLFNDYACLYRVFSGIVGQPWL